MQETDAPVEVIDGLSAIQERLIEQHVEEAKRAAETKRNAETALWTAYQKGKRGVFHQAFAYITALKRVIHVHDLIEVIGERPESRLERRNAARSNRRKSNGKGTRPGRLNGGFKNGR
jgi:hypothetical protein